MDSTIHDLDLGFWLSGSSPKRVYCQGQTFNPEIKTCGDFDLVVVTVLFGNGVVVVIDNGRKSSQAYDQRLEAICENGGYLVSNRPSSLASSSQQDQTLLAPIESHYIKRYTDAYRTELEHFLDVLEGRQEMLVTKRDTLDVMTLADAVVKSAKSGLPVDL